MHNVNNRQLIKTSRLSNQELRNIRNLVDLCAKHDGYAVRLYWNIMKDRQLPEFDDFLYYVNGKLIAYLATFAFKENEVEINAVVHPGYRNQGIFHYLIHEASIEISKRKIGYSLLVVHDSATKSIDFAKSIGAEYDHAECVMHLQNEPETFDSPEIKLQLAKPDDVEELARIDSLCFNTLYEKMVYRFMNNMKEKNRKAWLVINADGYNVGKTHVRFDNDNTGFIHDLCVLPEFRRQRYGSALVMALIKQLKKLNCRKIYLDVLADNTNAIGMYERCGLCADRCT